jgi:hypothetical protein
MALRLELQALLETICPNVYFQPPTNVLLTYPCIVYERDSGDTKFADDKPYTHTVRYQIVVIDRDPDSPILAQIAALPMCLFNRFYSAANLNHNVYNLYF